MTIVPYPQPLAAPARPSWIEVMDRGLELAEVIANTDFVPRAMRGNQPAILAAILYGHELGIEPMQALAKISNIEGRPTLAAETQRALILAAGHELWIEESTATRATVAGRRRGSKVTQRVTWTLDDAKRARLAGRPNYQAYPRQMLIARASAELARQVFPDVIGGMAATEELEDVADGDTPTVELEQETPAARTRTRRRRAPAAAAAIAQAPEPPPLPDEPADAEASPAPEPPAPPIPPPTPAPPAPTPDADPDAPNRAQLGKLFALYREHGLGGDEHRDRRLAHAERTLGRPIKSSKELSALDVSRIIEALVADGPGADPAPAPEPGAVLNVTQRGTLLGLFAEKGIEPDLRLVYLERVTGRRLESATELTPDEADAVIAALRAEPVPPLPANEQEVADALELELNATPVDDPPPLPGDDFPAGF